MQPAVVTSIESSRAAVGGRGRYLCAVARRDGSPLTVRIWRGCGQATRPGDALTVVYDPQGHVAPRGMEAGAGMAGALRDLAPWAVSLVAESVIAVVRSYRLCVPSIALESPGRGVTSDR